MFSKSCQYGLQAVVLLSLQPEGKLLMIKDISERMNIPAPYLAKILQTLSKKGFLASTKGPNGGFKLAKSADEIIFRDIIDCLDGLENFEKCVIGFEKCGDTKNLCPFHEDWAKIKEEVIEKIFMKTISDLNNLKNRDVPEVVQKMLFF